MKFLYLFNCLFIWIFSIRVGDHLKAQGTFADVLNLLAIKSVQPRGFSSAIFTIF